MTREELRSASNAAAKFINASTSSEERWRQVAAKWRKSGYVVPCKAKYVA